MENEMLENITKDEIFDRYIIGGTTEEMEDPDIQKLLIRNGFTDFLVESVLLITDTQVVEEILSSDLIENNNFKFIYGKIESMEFNIIEGEEFNFCSGKFKFIESKTKKEYILDRGFIIDENMVESFKKEIEPYKDNLIVIVEAQDEKTEIDCFLKAKFKL